MQELFKFFRWHKRRILNKTSWPRFGTHTASLSKCFLNSTLEITSYNYFFSLFFAGQSTMTFVSVKKQVHISMHLLLTRKDTITTVCTQQIIFHWIIQSIYQVSKLSPDFFKDVSFHVSFHVKFGYMGCCDFSINNPQNTCLVA